MRKKKGKKKKREAIAIVRSYLNNLPIACGQIFLDIKTRM